MEATFLADVLAFLGRHWKIIAIAGLLSTNAATLHACNDAHAALTKEKASHAADVQSYKNAQAAAQKLADDTKTRLQHENQEKADEADANYTTLLSKYRTSLLRRETTPRTSGQPGGGQSDGTAQGDNGPSYSTNVPAGSITITNSDADICAVNTARLQVAHDWAETLKDAQK